MAAQSLLAKLGMRVALLGTTASLAIAAPLADNNPSMAAHTDASRIGWYFDRTGGAEKIGHVVMGADSFSVGVTGIAVPGTVAIGQSTAAYKVDVLVSGNDGIRVANGSNQIYLGTTAAVAAVGTLTADPFSVITSGAVSISVAANGKSTFVASSTSRASINLPHGTAPTTPVNGDFWSTTSGFFGRVNGSTVGPFAAGGGGITGTLASGRVPYATGASTVTDSAKMVFSDTTGFNVNMASIGANNLTLGTGAGVLLSAGHSNVFLGVNVGDLTAGNSIVAVGFEALNGPVSGTGSIAIGHRAGLRSGSSTDSIFLGRSAGANLNGIDNTMVVGSASAPILECYLGKGKISGGTLTEVLLSATVGLDDDQTGMTLVVAGGAGTGLAAGGNIILKTATVGPIPDDTNNPLVARLSILSDGAVSWTGITTANSPAVSTASNGTIFFDSTLQKFRVSQNGGAYADLVGGGGITGTLVSGRVPFANGTSSVTDSARMVFSASTGFNVNMASSGANNLTLGTNAGTSLGTGASATAVGVSALSACTVSENTAVGAFAADGITSSIGIVAMGFNALGAATNNASNCTAVGHQALLLATGGSNTAIGSAAGDAITTGTQSTAIGHEALSAAAGNGQSTAVGYRALFANTAVENTAVGCAAADDITTSTGIVAVGFSALGAGTTGVSNSTAIGHSALALATNVSNTAVGAFAADAVTSSAQITAIGHDALGAGSTGVTNCTAIGYQALLACTVAENTAVGSGAADAITTSTGIVAIGFNALGTGINFAGDCTAVGHSALAAVTSGNANTALGKSAGLIIAGGGSNVVIGAVVAPSLVTGSNNVIIGVAADAGSAISNGVAIGTLAVVGASQSIALGYGATTTASNQCVIGGSTYEIATVYIGRGVTNASPLGSILTTTGGSGTNIAAANLTLAGGRGTGTGAGGSVLVQTAPAGSSGASLNAFVTALTIDHRANVVLGTAALATGATDGFLYIPTCAGTPSGTPSTYTDRSPIIYDTTANKLWVYNGSWRGIVLV